jgi:hypothetical protein
VTGQELAKDDVLLGPAEEPGSWVPAQRRALSQYAETKGLVGPGKGFGRGATHPGRDAIAQIRGRSP